MINVSYLYYPWKNWWWKQDRVTFLISLHMTHANPDPNHPTAVQVHPYNRQEFKKIPLHKSLYSTIYKQYLEDKMLAVPDYWWIYWHQLSKALCWHPMEIVKPLPWVKTLIWKRSLSSHKLNLIWNNWAQKPSPFFPIPVHLLHWNCYQIYFNVGMKIHF